MKGIEYFKWPILRSLLETGSCLNPLKQLAPISAPVGHSPGLAPGVFTYCWVGQQLIHLGYLLPQWGKNNSSSDSFPSTSTGYAWITRRVFLSDMPRSLSSSALSRCKKYFLPLSLSRVTEPLAWMGRARQLLAFGTLALRPRSACD